MSNLSKFVLIIIKLSDGRILTERRFLGDSGLTSQWSATVESFLSLSDQPIPTAIDTLWSAFSLDFRGYQKEIPQAKLTQLTPHYVVNMERIIHPFLIEMKTSLAFRAAKTRIYTAVRPNDLINDLLSTSVYALQGMTKYTSNTIFTMADLHRKKVFENVFGKCDKQRDLPAMWA